MTGDGSMAQNGERAIETRVLRFGGVEVKAPTTWQDVTDELDLPDPPFTLASVPAGVGALQFSVALHSGGSAPDPSPDDLMLMVEESAERHDLTQPHDQVTDARRFRLAAVSYRAGDDFMRVWYVSDGVNFAKVTYTCEWGRQDDELPKCEAIVRTLRFDTDPTPRSLTP